MKALGDGRPGFESQQRQEACRYPTSFGLTLRPIQPPPVQHLEGKARSVHSGWELGWAQSRPGRAGGKRPRMVEL
jgi:hypothetical protein